VLAAIDFTTVEVWTKGGLVTYYLLFVMELAIRQVQLAACTPSLGDMFMKQIARNLTDPIDGFLKDKRYGLMLTPRIDAWFAISQDVAINCRGAVAP